MLFNFNCVAAGASDDYILYANEIIAQKDIKTTVPVNLKNNKGIMGFKITVEYNPENVDISSVEKGIITSIGNFTTNFGTSNKKFDIIWNNTDEVSMDGSLFVLYVICKKSDQIKISYSQQDTFNEKYDDVVLNCNDISVKLIDSQSVDMKSTKTYDFDPYDEEVIATDSQILQAISKTLDELQCVSPEEIKNEGMFIELLNKNISEIIGSDRYKIEDFNSFKKIYINACTGNFIKEISNNFSGYEIENFTNDALKRIGVKSIDKIPEDKKIAFVEIFESYLKSNNSNVPNLSQELSADDAVETIKKLNSAHIQSSDKDKVENFDWKVKCNKAILFLLIILMAFMVICLAYSQKNIWKGKD